MTQLSPEYAAVLDAVRGIGWPARRRAGTTMAGPHQSAARGGAAELVEYRPYRQGDETSRIDWRLMARTNRVYTRISFDHTILPTMLVVDASASMAFPVATHAKWRLARQLAVGLAGLARDRGDPVGLLVADDHRVVLLRPRTRRTIIGLMTEALDREPAGQRALAPMLPPVTGAASRIVVLSDCLGDSDAMREVLRTFVLSGGELYVVHIVAGEELDPDPARQLLVDPEAPAVRRPLTTRTRSAYLQRFGAWREALARDWRELGASYSMVVPAAEPVRQMIRRIVRPAVPPSR
ncbi:MAG: DUF58 domain-containing protein [Gemmatimonadota bacterium]